MEHLSLEIFDLDGKGGSQYAFLPDDVTITITDTSEIFASGDVWSKSFTLNVYANAHIFGTAGDMHGARLHEQIDRRRARLWVEGEPLYLGYLMLGGEAEVDAEGNVDVTLESGQKTFDEMVDGAKANQVPMMGDVPIGMALWRKRWAKYSVRLTASVPVAAGGGVYDKATAVGPVIHTVDNVETEWFDFTVDGEEEGCAIQEYPRMVLPVGLFTDASGQAESVNCINTDSPYEEDADGTPMHPFCNVALCYQKYGYDKKDKNGVVNTDYSADPEAQRGYEYMPASRVNSAPNFYVIYWLRCLMKHLGIHVEENQMLDVQDLRRLFFVNTDCAYEEPKKLRTVTPDARFGRFLFGGGGRIIPEYINPKRNINTEESGFAGTDVVNKSSYTIGGVTLKVEEVREWDAAAVDEYQQKNSYFHRAYASSDCFPDADISEVIKAVEDGFGMRMIFSDNYRKVRIVLLRNVFRDRTVQHIDCDVISEQKTESPVRGFRMTYGAGTEDTQFYYKGFNDKLPHKKELWQDNSDKHDYSFWDLNAEYANVIKKVSAFDKTCYYTPATGDAYGIKVDKDAKRYDELHPSLFEYGGFMDAEDGDCTGEEETIEEVSVGFKPAIMNDLNMEEERRGSRRQRFALFVSEEMRPRRPDLLDGADYNDPDAVYSISRLYSDGSPASGMKADGIVKPGEFAFTSDMFASGTDATAEMIFYQGIMPEVFTLDHLNFDGHINEGYRLYLQDNYEPNDNGVSPIETHDWGLTLGIMRGSGGDMYVDYSADPDDGEENDTWEISPGSSVTAHPDTCDSYGQEWDYNGGVAPGTTAPQAERELLDMFPNSNAPFSSQRQGYITGAEIIQLNGHDVLFVIRRSISGTSYPDAPYLQYLSQDSTSAFDIRRKDADGGQRLIVETDSSSARRETLLDLCAIAYGGATAETEEEQADNGIGEREGRISLKLRAEKPNPYFDPTQPESAGNRRYLQIDNESLRGRGLADKFYKEYSYWVRNARTDRMTVRMELAQLMAIDKTKKVEVGDITGFVRKIQYPVSKKTGIGDVTMEIMYI